MRWLASCPPRWCLEVTNVSTASCISQEKRGRWPRSSDSEIPSYFLASVRSGPTACANFRSTTGCARVPKRIVGRTAAWPVQVARRPGSLHPAMQGASGARKARRRTRRREEGVRMPGYRTGTAPDFFRAFASDRYCSILYGRSRMPNHGDLGL